MTVTEEEVVANRGLWVDALTGRLPRKFRKHTGSLASPRYRSFCCLGVACEAVPGLAHRTTGGTYEALIGGMRKLDEDLEDGQRAALGLTGGMTYFLIRLNDSRRVPLKVIGVVVSELPVSLPDSPLYDWRAADFEQENPIVRAALEPYPGDGLS